MQAARAQWLPWRQTGGTTTGHRGGGGGPGRRQRGGGVRQLGQRHRRVQLRRVLSVEACRRRRGRRAVSARRDGGGERAAGGVRGCGARSLGC